LSAISTLRIGTLEITAALAAVAFVAGRPRLRADAERGRVGPVRLVLGIDERGTHRSFDGLAPFDVGRDKEAVLPLPDPEVSRRHARFELRDGIVFVRDLESRNGTFLNGRRVSEPIEVRVGDEIDVGTTRLRIEDLRGY
jgi:pSer/pThr/pTyr-binding forkhead associated (FHA) protein